MKRYLHPWFCSLCVLGFSGCIPLAAPTSGAGAANTPEGKACGPDGVIDDAEDDNNQVAQNKGRGGYWYTFLDKAGSSVTPQAGGTFAMAPGGANGSAHAAHITGKVGGGQVVYAGVGLNFVDPKGLYNASAYKGISFWAKASPGSATKVRIKVPDVDTDPDGKVCTECFNDFGADIELTNEWAQYTLPFSSLTQLQGWGAPHPGSVNAEKLYGIQWQVNTPGAAFDIWVDDVQFTGCTDAGPATTPGTPAAPSGGQHTSSTTAAPQAPSLPPAAPTPPVKNTGNVQLDRFLTLWTDIHKLSNGYFSPEGIPYHAVETLIVEAPDQGHETTSEAYSYWIWLESVYGKVTKDWSFLDRAWASLEYYMIPRPAEQPTNTSYSPTKPATYAEEGDLPNQYPKPLDASVAIGHDPIFDELKAAYGNANIYGMHWLMDVDNWYGFGRMGDGTSHAALINTFQRGPQESVFETVTQPTWDTFKWGGPNGYLDIFQKGSSFARQWKYTAAPDADARAIQAVYWAKTWADEQGGSPSVDAIAKKAGKLGDFARYSLFDKYFKKIGCTSPGCPTASDYTSAHYLISWYYAWGGSAPGGGGWAWRIGSSHNHSGYQNPMAAYALSQAPALRPASAGGARDWGQSLGRQIEFYRWLQSAEGAIAGGATNSWKGRYEAPPKGAKTFYGMAYDEAPVFTDPPSNEWFGFQAWTMERVAEYYYVTGDKNAKLVLDKWVAWVRANTKLGKDNAYEVPATLKWSGQPSADWNDKARSFTDDKGFNASLHVHVLDRSEDVGTAAALAQTLAFYAKKSGDKEAQRLAKELLDRMWAKHRDDKGLTTPETRKDYKRFNEAVYVPPEFKGKMPNGDPIDAKSTFLGLRTKFKEDPSWSKVKAYLDGGAPPTFTYHRFWAQAHCALAYATYGWLFPEGGK